MSTLEVLYSGWTWLTLGGLCLIALWFFGIDLLIYLAIAFALAAPGVFILDGVLAETSSLRSFATLGWNAAIALSIVIAVRKHIAKYIMKKEGDDEQAEDINTYDREP